VAKQKTKTGSHLEKFQRADDLRKSAEQRDDVGIVVVSVFLARVGHRPVKGNIQRKVRLKDCQVSKVFQAILDSIVKVV
jgi:hypothetical protein